MNNKNKPFSIAARGKSFGFAFAGLKSFFRTEHNSWIHVGAALVSIILGNLLNLSNYDWCLVIIAIALVLTAEVFNTAIESLTDMISPNYSDLAKKVKDLSAAAVLIAAIAALCIGLIIFLPKLFNNGL